MRRRIVRRTSLCLRKVPNLLQEVENVCVAEGLLQIERRAELKDARQNHFLLIN